MALLRTSAVGLALIAAVGATAAFAQEPPPPPPSVPAPDVAPAAAPGAAPPPSRLDTIDPAQRVLGTVPRPDARTQQQIDRLVDRIADPAATLDLVIGRPRLLELKQPPKRVQVPDEKVASYDVITDTELSVTGKAVGSTVLNLWFDDPKAPGGRALLSYLVRVFPDPQAAQRLQGVYRGLEDEVNKAFPDCKVSIALVGDNVIVRGECKTSNDVTQILRIVAAGAPDALANIPADAAGGGSTSAAGRLGPLTPPIGNFAQPALSVMLGQQGRNGGGGGGGGAGRGGGEGTTNRNRVINLLRVPGENQVMLKVTVAEVNRSAARSIGMNFQVKSAAGIDVFANNTGNLANFSNSGSGSGRTFTTTGNLPMVFDNGQVAVALQALRQLSLAKSLAEPNLVAVNGQTAQFQAGGQFPVPVVTGATATGLQGVTFIPFGVQLSFTPYVTDRDRIRLVISGDVSTRDASIGTQINGANVAGVDTRNFGTTVDLKPGQSLAIAGLVQQNFGSNANRIPLFGDVPILSSLLGTNNTSAAEQELVVLVTADTVEPLDPEQVPPLPGSDIFDPDDLEFYLGGRLESAHARDFRSPTRTDFDRLVKYQRLEQQYLIGPTGYSDPPASAPAGGKS